MRQKGRRRDARERELVELSLHAKLECLIEAVRDQTLTDDQRYDTASEILVLYSLLGKNETVH